MKDTRKAMEQTLKETLRNLVLKIHEKDNLTQVKIANALLMDRRSLADIEAGEHMCGELTIIFILIYLSDTDSVLGELKRQFEVIYNNREVYV